MANEKRLIDANALVEKLQTDFEKVYTNAGKKVKPEDYYIERKSVYDADFLKAEVDMFCTMVDCFPTVDAVEVVHGRWEWLGPNNLIPECMCGTCSACKVRSKYIVNTDLCPNCGAKMDGDGNGS